ncbi:hypothetical protein D1872_136710 [compost metagenome]
MALPDKIHTLPTWSKKDANKWADYIELSCLKSIDKFFSVDDMLDHYSDERPEELDRGSQDHSAKYDRIASTISIYFDLIKFRSDTLGECYPFELEDNKSISLKEKIEDIHLFYFFLLFSSNTSFFDPSTVYSLTHAFEDISATILHSISSPLAITEVFGTSRPNTNGMYRGSIRERISTLAKNISAVTSKVFDSDPRYNTSSGDGGLDLVSYIRLDEMPFIPLSFGQCACSYDDWEDKQSSINPDKWLSRLNNLAPYLQFTFVPFYCRRSNGEFDNPTGIHTCLIDRHRIFKIITSNSVTIDEFARHNIYQWVSKIYVS